MQKIGTWSKLGLVVVGGLGLLYLGAAGVSSAVVSGYLLPKVRAVSADVREHHEKILADLKLLDANPIFSDGPRTKDAQELISRYIGWTGDGAEPIATPAYQSLEALKKDYSKLGEVETIEKLSADPRTATVDVSWVDQIESYDHWSFASAPIVKKELERAKELNGVGRIGVFATMPMPNYILFQFATLVRFIQLQKSGEALKGLKLMRHVSYLAHTSPTLIGAMIATTGLGREHTVVEAFGVKNWQLVDREKIAAYKRVSWAWGGLIHEVIWEKLPAEFEPFVKPRNGVCAMTGERALGSGIQDFLVPTVPLETNFSAQLKQGEDFTRKLFEVCSTPEYEVYLSPSPESSNPLFAKGYNSVWQVANLGADDVDTNAIGINPSRIPFIRRAVGLMLMTIATPNYLGQYEKLEVARQ